MAVLPEWGWLSQPCAEQNEAVHYGQQIYKAAPTSSDRPIPYRRHSDCSNTMRLLNVHTLALEDFIGEEVPAYCILSHRWGKDEVSHKEYRKGDKRDGAGYRKIVEFCAFVKHREEHYDNRIRTFADGPCDWVWIDTCRVFANL